MNYVTPSTYTSRKPEFLVERLQDKRSPKRLTLLRFYYPLVPTVVQRITRKIPSYANHEDLHSAGVTGLIKAMDRYDQSDRDRFGGYVAMRVKGAVMDELRRQDPLTRNARSKCKHYQQAHAGLVQELRRVPSEDEIAAAMGVSTLEIRKLKQKIEVASYVSWDQPMITNTGNASLTLGDVHEDVRARPPSRDIESKELFVMLKDKIGTLDERQRYLVEQYYYEGRKLVELAREFGVSEARVCQLHAAALRQLRIALVSENEY